MRSLSMLAVTTRRLIHLLQPAEAPRVAKDRDIGAIERAAGSDVCCLFAGSTGTERSHSAFPASALRDAPDSARFEGGAALGRLAALVNSGMLAHATRNAFLRGLAVGVWRCTLGSKSSRCLWLHY
jgi:hypothetical protein